MDLLRMVVKKRSQAKERQQDVDLLKGFSARVAKLKGEGALATSDEPEVALEVVSININDIEIPSQYMRKSLGNVDDLVASIKVYGVQQPIKVIKIKGSKKYRLVFGRRRVKAAQLAGFDAIPCIVELVTREDRLMMLSLVENLNRRHCSPIEEASAYRYLIKQSGSSPNELCKNLGQSSTYLTEIMDLLTLPETVCKEALKNSDLFSLDMLNYVQSVFKASANNGQALFQAIEKGQIKNIVDAHNFMNKK